MVTAPAGRRRLDTTARPEYEVPTREPRLVSPASVRLANAGVFTAWAIGTAMSATSVIAIDAPSWIERPGAAILLLVFAVGLTHRSGGHMRIWATLAGVLGLAAVVTETAVLLAGAATTTAVLSAVGAVMITRPATNVPGVLTEYAISLGLALSGTVAVAAWNAPVTYQRFGLSVLAASLGLAIILVWNLGAGLHGLQRQNLAVLAGVAALVVIVVAYSSFVRTHGSETITTGIEDLIIWMRQVFGGVPRPVEVIIGFPALIVGVSMRSRNREGWWILVFAVLGTGFVTTSLVSPGAFPTYIALSTLYSAILGLGVGLVARHLTMRDRSARAARAVEQQRRVEPPRLAALK
jgi:hypothetical protein